MPDSVWFRALLDKPGATYAGHSVQQPTERSPATLSLSSPLVHRSQPSSKYNPPLGHETTNSTLVPTSCQVQVTHFKLPSGMKSLSRCRRAGGDNNNNRSSEQGTSVPVLKLTVSPPSVLRGWSEAFQDILATRFAKLSSILKIRAPVLLEGHVGPTAKSSVGR